ncbi:MAG: hypothetical protein ACREUA_04265, partial [Burkholderiales bacterium]
MDAHLPVRAITTVSDEVVMFNRKIFFASSVAVALGMPLCANAAVDAELAKLRSEIKQMKES